MSIYLGNSPVGVNAIYSPEAIAQVIIDRIYPIGSIYMSVNSDNPSTYLGGTWIAWGSGRVPVGVDTNDTNFDDVEKTGGVQTVALTLAQMPQHRHAPSDRESAGSESGYKRMFTTNLDLKSESVSRVRGVGSGRYVMAATTANDISQAAYTDYQGRGDAHNNLQPYITCYMWKRTA